MTHGNTDFSRRLPDEEHLQSRIGRIDAVFQTLSSHTAADPLTARSVQPLFLVELIAIGQLVVAGYNLLGRPGGLDTSAVEGVLNTLQGVNTRIDQVGKRVGELFTALDRLDGRVKGYINQGYLSEANGLIRSISDDLGEILVNSETIVAERPKLESRTQDLKDRLEVIREFTNGGLAGCCLMAPGIALWVQSYTAIQRAKNVQLIHTVWDHPFHARNMEMFREVFETDKILTKQYEQWTESFPKKDTVYAYSPATPIRPEDLVATGTPFKEVFSDGEANENMFCYTDIQGFIYPQFCHIRRLPPALGLPARWIWDQFWSRDRATPVQEGARRVDARIEAQKGEIYHYGKMMKGADSVRQMIDAYCTRKPKSWGGTSADPTTALVHLNNVTWNRVNVEVRRGRENSCASNAVFQTKILEKGELWTIPAPNVDICYRRDANPDHPNGQWTDWRKTSIVDDGEYYEVIV
jgi:hypothetical protein